MRTSSTRLKTTPLIEAHREMGARFVAFAGWEMPLQYAGVIAEVRAVRENCGVFDVSHLGQLRFEGAGVTQWLNEIVACDWSNVAPGRAAYALLLNKDGGVLDDVMGYRLAPDAWLVVVNASRIAIDEAHFRRYLVDGIEMQNGEDISAMIAIQGARSAEVLKNLIGENLHDVAWRDVILLGGTEGVLARGGDTGGDGFEIMFNAPDALRVWNALLQQGAVPCGLGARDVLRIEAGLPLYGQELREAWTPDESGLAWAAQIEKPSFIGREALLERRAQFDENTPTIRALQMNGKAIAREGYRVLDVRNHDIGEVTSGTMSPTLGCGIALASLPRRVQIGDVVNVEIRGTLHAAQVVQPPFVADDRNSQS